MPRSGYTFPTPLPFPCEPYPSLPQYPLYGSAAAGSARSMHVIAPANAKLSRPEIHRDDYEMCWVLKGKIKFSLPNETYILSGGDSIQFDALLTHNYETLENSEILIVHIKKGKRF